MARQQAENTSLSAWWHRYSKTVFVYKKLTLSSLQAFVFITRFALPLNFINLFWEDRMAVVQMSVNGQAVEQDVPDNTLLVSFIRETLGLTGTHVGCDTSQCGACGSCHGHPSTQKLLRHSRAEVTTIEGIANGDELHPCSRPFMKITVAVGYCTPGMVMSAIELRVRG